MRLMTPHRVGSKYNDMAFPDRHIDDGRFSCKLSASRKHPAHKQFLFIGYKPQNHAGSEIAGSALLTYILIIVRIIRITFGRRTLLRHSLNHIGVREASTP